MITARQPSSTRLCLHVLLQLMDLRAEDTAIVQAALMGVDRLLGSLGDAEKTETLRWVIQKIVSHEGDDVCDGLLHMLLHHGAIIPAQCAEVCRVLLKRYEALAASTRMALLQLAVKLALAERENAVVQKMAEYVMELNGKDLDVEVRVQARNIKAVDVGDGCEG